MTDQPVCKASPTGQHERIDMAGDFACKHCGVRLASGRMVMTAELRASLLLYVGRDDVPPVGAVLGRDGVWRLPR